MAQRLSIRPKAGLVVKNPMTRMPLPWDRTTMVPANQFWFRRLKAGDVELASEKVSVKKPKAEKKEKVLEKEKSEE